MQRHRPQLPISQNKTTGDRSSGSYKDIIAKAKKTHGKLYKNYKYIKNGNKVVYKGEQLFNNDKQ